MVRINLIKAGYRTCKTGESYQSVNFNSISLADLDVCQTSEPIRDIKYALAKADSSSRSFVSNLDFYCRNWNFIFIHIDEPIKSHSVNIDRARGAVSKKGRMPISFICTTNTYNDK